MRFRKFHISWNFILTLLFKGIWDNFMSFGNRIKEARKSKKWTQAMLAEKVGVSDRLISEWENDKVTPHRNNYRKLIEVLGVSDKFFSDEYKLLKLLVFKKVSDKELVFNYDSWKKEMKYEYVCSDLMRNEIFNDDINSLSQEEIDDKYFILHRPHNRTHIIKRDFKEIVDGKWFAVIEGDDLDLKKLFNGKDGKWYSIKTDVGKFEDLIIHNIRDKEKILANIGKDIIKTQTYEEVDRNLIVGIELTTIIKLER